MKEYNLQELFKPIFSVRDTFTTAPALEIEDPKTNDNESWGFIKMAEPDIVAGGKILHKICKRYLKKLNKNYHEN